MIEPIVVCHLEDHRSVKANLGTRVHVPQLGPMIVYKHTLPSSDYELITKDGLRQAMTRWMTRECTIKLLEVQVSRKLFAMICRCRPVHIHWHSNVLREPDSLTLIHRRGSLSEWNNVKSLFDPGRACVY